MDKKKVVIPNSPSPDQNTTVLYLKVLNTGDIISLTGKRKFTLGRISGDQPIMPDIDLSPYQAYEYGVSRLHALIDIMEEMVTITDLGSMNGCKINGKPIQPLSAVPIRSGDYITLGMFKTQILWNKDYSPIENVEEISTISENNQTRS